MERIDGKCKCENGEVITKEIESKRINCLFSYNGKQIRYFYQKTMGISLSRKGKMIDHMFRCEHCKDVIHDTWVKI